MCLSTVFINLGFVLFSVGEASCTADTTTDTRWDDIKALAKKGDYLFVSFCINDVGNRTTVQTNPYLVGDSGDRFSHRTNIKEFKDLYLYLFSYYLIIKFHIIKK